MNYTTPLPYGSPCRMCGTRNQWSGDLDARNRKVYRCTCGYVYHHANGSEQRVTRTQAAGIHPALSQPVTPQLISEEQIAV